MSLSELLPNLGVVLLAIGLTAVGAFLIMDPRSPVRIRWAGHVADLDRECRFLFYKTTGTTVARTELGVCAFLVILTFALGEFPPLTLVPLVFIVPITELKRRHEQRVLLLQKQLDTFLMMLSNALRATPSLGEALAATTRIMHPPTSQELDLCVKEMRLGTPLDQAILNMGHRIKSRSVSGALTTILVGRQTGGDLSRILEQSAASLREMSRLEGVVRTKTAEVRAQTYVLIGMPFVAVGGFYYVDPKVMEPLWTTGSGNAMLVVAGVFWLAAILIARKTLKVDI